MPQSIRFGAPPPESAHPVRFGRLGDADRLKKVRSPAEVIEQMAIEVNFACARSAVLARVLRLLCESRAGAATVALFNARHAATESFEHLRSTGRRLHGLGHYPLRSCARTKEKKRS